MARRWTHRCARVVARAIGLGVSPAPFPQQNAPPIIHKRLKLTSNLRFTWQGPQFHVKCSADCNSRIDVGFQRHFRPFDHHSRHRSRPFGPMGQNWRSFGAISGPEVVGEKTGKGTLKEGPRVPGNRALGRRHGASASVRRLKERGFDDIIERDKKLKILLRIKDLLGAERTRSMTVLDLGKSKKYIGFKGNGRLVEFLKRYPSVFRVHETAEFGKLPWFQFAPEAEAAFEEELEIQKGMDNEVVAKLRKLLMMSREKALPLSKIAHLGRDLGLPDDFRKSLVYEYPGFFRVVGSDDPLDYEGPQLELVRWSSPLAVTEDEKKPPEQPQEFERDSLPMSDRTSPKRHRLSKFDEVTCPSPYQDGNYLHPRSMQFEKRAVLLVQELLSLTLEKRVLVDHLTHFRKEFNFSRKFHGMLIRHPEYFYVSRKGSRETLFLRGAFEKVHVTGNRKGYGLIDKHPLVLVKEKLAALMEVNQLDFNMRRGQVPFQERGILAYDRTVSTPKVPW